MGRSLFQKALPRTGRPTPIRGCCRARHLPRAGFLAANLRATALFVLPCFALSLLIVVVLSDLLAFQLALALSLGKSFVPPIAVSNAGRWRVRAGSILCAGAGQTCQPERSNNLILPRIDALPTKSARLRALVRDLTDFRLRLRDGPNSARAERCRNRPSASSNQPTCSHTPGGLR